MPSVDRTKRIDERPSAYWRARSSRTMVEFYKYFVDFVNGSGVESILDIGTGPTLYLNDLNIQDITGIDLLTYDDYELLKPNIKTIKGNFVKSSTIEDRKYDIVSSLQTIEHIENKVEFIKKCFRIANKYVIISFPYMWDTKKSYDEHRMLDETFMSKLTNEVMDQSIILNKRMICIYKIKKDVKS